MKTIYRYTLAPYQGPHSRYTCPRCQKQRQFVRYIDTQQGTHLGEYVGRCNREINCGYHYTPKQYFAEQKGFCSEPLPRMAPQNPPPKPNTNRIEHRLFCRTLQQYEQNTFANYLTKLLSPKKAQALIEQFYIGTAKHWPGATIFWQIDLLGEVRTGKIMRYGEDGKRIRKPFNHIQWVHRQLPVPQFQLQQCLFGLHQLRKAPEDKTIALVESEKTAVIATAHFPTLLWLATGSVHQLRPERCKDLKGRNVILFPDVGAWKLWQEKAHALRKVVERPVLVSDWLEKQASVIERAQGQDLADYLTRR